MNKKKLLKSIQEYSDKAFLQGYIAKERGIDFNDTKSLSKMPEAIDRIDIARKIYNRVKNTNLQM